DEHVQSMTTVGSTVSASPSTRAGDRQPAGHQQRAATAPDGGARAGRPQPGEVQLIEELGSLPDTPQRAVGAGGNPLEAETLVFGGVQQPLRRCKVRAVDRKST